MTAKPRSYTLRQSPLYRLRSRRKLSSLFGLSATDFEHLIRREDNYRIFAVQKSGNKRRQVETPKPKIERLHRRLFQLLQRITPPPYLFSGVKGRSYIDNALQHIGQPRILTIDIERFFPSTKGWHVYAFFAETMDCSPDVSELLTALSVCNGHVPTGSCLSQMIAFYAHHEMFQQLAQLAESRSLVFTAYVDDLTFSGHRANRSLVYEVRGVLKRRGLRSSTTKERLYDIGYPAEVTGSIVTETGLRLPNRKHHEIAIRLLELLQLPDAPLKQQVLTKLLGKVIAAQQTDPRFTKLIRTLRHEQRRLTKMAVIC